MWLLCRHEGALEVECKEGFDNFKAHESLRVTGALAKPGSVQGPW